MERQPAVYIMTNRRRGTLYVGVTSNLATRVKQHQRKLAPGFTERYGLDRLVYFEACECMYQAILREKQLKRWRWAWKIRLIERHNSEWRDLSGRL